MFRLLLLLPNTDRFQQAEDYVIFLLDVGNESVVFFLFFFIFFYFIFFILLFKQILLIYMKIK